MKPGTFIPMPTWTIGVHAMPGCVAYVSGPMTGIPEFNAPAFNAAAESLRLIGYKVLNPAELDHNTDPAVRAKMVYADYLARDVRSILDAKVTHMFMLPGWEKSKGATLEKHLAEVLGIVVLDYTTGRSMEPGKGIATAAKVSAVEAGKQLSLDLSKGVDAGFQIKDSGVRETYKSGMVRDTNAGKTLWHLVCDGPMLRRWAEHLTKGAQKYEPHNWMKAEGDEEYERFRESAFRHFMEWYFDENTGEDKAAGVFFNINGAEFVRANRTKELEAIDKG